MAKQTAIQPGTSVTVGTSSGVVFSGDSSATEIVLCNDSDAVIYLKLGSPAVLNTGVRLNAAGGSHVEEAYNGQITAISTGAGKNLTLTVV